MKEELESLAGCLRTNVGLAAPAFVRPAVGRVVEVRVHRLAEVAQVDLLNLAVFEAIRQAGPRVFICADFRDTTPIPRDVADAWSRAMREANRFVERSAALLDPSNTTFNLQIERVVRCAGNPGRRLFADQDELELWMRGFLEEGERVALHAFLSNAPSH